jgi:GT2 family glycosyltransferase
MNDLAIVILQFNTPQDVERNLRALKTAKLPEKTEIVVVNNGGNNANNKISKIAYEGLNVRFFDTPNDGFPTGNNFGIKKTNAKYIAMVNPDIVINENTFEVLLNYMKEHPKVGLVSPKLIYPDGKVQDNYRVFPRPFDLVVKRTPFLRTRMTGRMRQYLMWGKDPDKNEPVDWTTGAFQMLSRECWDKAGPNEEGYFLFMSDVEICWKAWEAGFEVHFVGKASALHNDERLSEGGFWDIFKRKTMRIHINDSIKYFKKYIIKSSPRKN